LKIVDTPLCKCGQIQTIKHVAEVCPLTKYEGGITKPYWAPQRKQRSTRLAK